MTRSCGPVRPDRDGGSALVEALVSVTLVAIAAASVTAVVRATAASELASADRVAAVAVARIEVELLHAVDPEAWDAVLAAAPGHVWSSIDEREHAGRRLRVERRLARSGSAAAAPTCAGQAPTDVAPVRGTVRVDVLARDDDARSTASLTVPVAIAPRWPSTVDGAIVVRVDDGGSDRAALAGVEVIIDGPLDRPDRVVRAATTDAEGCAWAEGLDTGMHRVTVVADGRVDTGHRPAGVLPDGSGPVSASEVSLVVGVSRGSRPALTVSLPRAVALRVEALEPAGAVSPDAIEEGPSTRSLAWWFIEEEDPRATPFGAVRWVAPGRWNIAIGACVPGAVVPIGSTVELRAGEEVLHLAPLVAVTVLLGGAAGGVDGSDDGSDVAGAASVRGDGIDGEERDGLGAADDGADAGADDGDDEEGDGPAVAAPDRVVLVVRHAATCDVASSVERWTLKLDGSAHTIGLPVGTATLSVESPDGRVLVAEWTVAVREPSEGPTTIELAP